ncbi:MAG: Ldh family oxidoreductase [Terrimesophilobacter sp.]
MMSNSAGTTDRLVTAQALTAYVVAVFVGLGARDSDARAVAQVLVGANLTGHDSHGISLIPGWAESIRVGDIDVQARPEIRVDADAMVAIDANRALGPVAGALVCAEAAERASRHGVAVVTMRDSGHLGRLGEYVSRLTRQRFASVAVSNCQGNGLVVVPTGASGPRLTSNALALGVPNGGDGVVADLALTAIALSRVYQAQRRGTRLTVDALVDGNGQPSNDPSVLATGGGVVPLGAPIAGHKGTGLLMLVDLLAGVLSGGGVCGAPSNGFANALTLIAIDVSKFGDQAAQDEMTRRFQSHVANTVLGTSDIESLLPGERATRIERQRTLEGIPVSEHDLVALHVEAKKVGLNPGSFIS